MSVKNGTFYVDIIPEILSEPELPETPDERNARLIKFANVNIQGVRYGKPVLSREQQRQRDAEREIEAKLAFANADVQSSNLRRLKPKKHGFERD